MSNVTRGDGLLEGFLAKKRAQKAETLMGQPKKGVILDIGCGSYPYFLINSNFSEKFGVDPSLQNTDIKGVNLKKLNVAKAPLPFKDNFFDAVTMLAVFEHLDKNKLNFVLGEVRRVLKKDGVFVITTPSPWADKLLHQMARVGLISSEEIHEHKHNLSHHTIREFLLEAGFSSKNITNGFFELSFNMWFRSQK